MQPGGSGGVGLVEPAVALLVVVLLGVVRSMLKLRILGFMVQRITYAPMTSSSPYMAFVIYSLPWDFAESASDVA